MYIYVNTCIYIHYIHDPGRWFANPPLAPPLLPPGMVSLGMGPMWYPHIICWIVSGICIECGIPVISQGGRMGYDHELAGRVWGDPEP